MKQSWVWLFAFAIITAIIIVGRTSQPIPTLQLPLSKSQDIRSYRAYYEEFPKQPNFNSKFLEAGLDGKISLHRENFKSNTTYNFSISCIDIMGNESGLNSIGKVEKRQ